MEATLALEQIRVCATGLYQGTLPWLHLS
jgi:hypothetical protein